MHVFRMASLGNNWGVLNISYMLKCLRLSLQGYRALRVRMHTQGDEGMNPTRTNADTHTITTTTTVWT